MTDVEVVSLCSCGKDGWSGKSPGEHVVKSREKGSLTELDNEPTPFKKVIGEKGEKPVKATNPFPMSKGKG